MRLIRLLGYALLGYVAYEMYVGMSEKTGSAVRQDAPASRGGRASAPKRMSTGGSKAVAVEGANGERTTKRVGRGVIAD